MSKECILILDNIRSVENTASIFRTAEGLGISKIILVGTTPTPLDRFGRTRKDFAKVSLGSENMVPWKYEKEISKPLSELKKQKHQIIALELTHESKDLKNFKPKNKLALIVGNEVDGISRMGLEFADEMVEIPMRGKKESLNVSVATGIALYMLI